MSTKIQDKNILFISPEFFGIEKSIIHAMEKLGAKVTWFDERSIRSSVSRAVNSVSPRVFNNYSDKYYETIIEKCDSDIDAVLIVKGEMVSEKTIQRIRNKWKNAEVILYLWDPVRNIKGILPKTKLYDRIISFEPGDCKKYGFEFRALFCDIENKDKGNSDTKKKYDVCFYGTMYADRFSIVYNMEQFCKNNNLKFYKFCFLRGKFMAFYYWFTNAGFRKLGNKAISYKSKSSVEIAQIINQSKVILDANDPYQQGLTLRTIETMALGRKMITTNKDIVNYDFYNPNNICVIERDSVTIPLEFFDKKYETLDQEIIKKYTAEGWVIDVFKESKI